MNMIALNSTTQPRQAKRATAKFKPSIVKTKQSDTAEKPAQSNMSYAEETVQLNLVN